MKKVNWGIIGLGVVATQFAKGFNFVDNGKLLGVASSNLERLNNFKDIYNLDSKNCFTNYQNLIENKEIDIIYIALPTSLHSEWVIKCLNNGKKVLVEKPATINSYEIIKIKENHLNKENFLTEAFMYLYHPQINKIIEIINSKKIGKLISMQSNFGHNILTKRNFLGFKKRKKMKPENRLYSKEMGGGAILDLGCYPVSFSVLIASLISNINYEKVEIINKKKEIGSTGVDLDSYAELKFENGFISRISASFTKNTGKQTKILGSEGELTIEDTWTAQPAKIIIKKNNAKNINIDIDAKKNIYAYEIESLSKSILDRKNKPDFPGLTIDNTIGNMKIIDKWIN